LFPKPFSDIQLGIDKESIEEAILKNEMTEKDMI
jgi:hypothetical protein